MTPDGQSELVVVQAQLVRYFVLASQTCDVCGVDKAALPWAVLLPVTPVVDTCKNERLPLKGNSTATIHEYCVGLVGFERVRNCHDDVVYTDTLRDVLKTFSSPDAAMKENISRIKNFLTKIHDRAIVCWLPGDAARQIPESLIEFTKVYTVPTSQIVKLMDRRVGRIGDPYRDQFARKFADQISRIAAPKPMKPAPL